MKRLAGMLKEAGSRWVDDSCYRLGASLAYYSLFSLFPLLLISVTILGLVLGKDPAVPDRLLASVGTVISPQLRAFLVETLASIQAHRSFSGTGAIVSVATLVFGASGAFSELQFALNRIWRVADPPSRGLWTAVLRAVRDKGISFVVVAGAALVLFLSLLVSTALSALGASAAQLIPSSALWLGLEWLASLGLSTIVFGIVFHLLPQTPVAWRDVVGGALLTAILFNVLKNALAWYLGNVGSYASYGALGAVLGLMTWIYLASLCLFFGAELTRVYAEQAGSLSAKGVAARAD